MNPVFFLPALLAVAMGVSPMDMEPGLMAAGFGDQNDIDLDQPSLRDAAIRDPELLAQSSLWGHKYMAGGAGKGGQYLMPDGSVISKQEVKTDAVLPAYCEPPNPCPPGFTGEDGCLEDFENSADFSREYQARQDCMCDEEHMFSCPPSHKKVSDLLHAEDAAVIAEFSDGLNRLLQNANIKDHHKTLVAKKFHAKRAPAKRNPYLADGEPLRVVAKKG